MATKYDKATLDTVVNEYISTDATLEEVSLMYGVSSTTISRHLAELGHTTMKRYKTNRENSMLEYLQKRGINNLETLVKFI